MNKYAPIIIPTLNRFEHFKHCTESLSYCTDADKTDLYIALDYPSKEIHWEGYNKINSFINEITGFKTVNVIRRNKNYGPVYNTIEAETEIYKKYDRLIITEDDNIFSINFLEYINKGLDKYEDNDNIYAVCGYNYPIMIPENYKSNYYFYKTVSAWGCGYWKNKQINVLNTDAIRSYLNNPFYALKLQKHSSKTFSYLLSMLKSKDIYGDTITAAYLVKNNKYCVFPVVSKVRNMGHDGTGVNCEELLDSTFMTQKIDTKTEFVYCPDNTVVIDNILIKNVLMKYSSLDLISKIKVFITYILFFTSNIFKS